MEGSPHTNDSERFAISYLERYESMIQAQDVEEKATILHLRPIFQTIQRLGGGNDTHCNLTTTDFLHTSAQNHPQPSLVQDTSFTANHEDTFLNAPEKSNKSFGKENHSGVLTSARNIPPSLPYDRVSYQTIKCFIEKPLLLSISDAKDYEVLQTDEQLCMILENVIGDHVEENNDGISFAEFIHLYKTAVSGMQALQVLPGKDAVSGRDRERTKKRTMLMIRSFSKLDITSFATNNDSNASLISDENVIITTTKAHKPRISGYANGEDFTNDSDTVVNDDEDDDEEYDEIVDDTTKKEAMISNEFLQREIKILAVVREKSEQIEMLNKKIRQGKKRLLLSFLLCLCLSPFATPIGSSLKNKMDLWKEPSGNITNGQPPVTVEVSKAECLPKDIDDSAETKEKLAFALEELGMMVLAMSKKEEALSSCLANNVPCEESTKCDPCDNSTIMSNSVSFADEVANNPKLKSLVIRRQVVAAVGAAIATSLPALLPTQGIVQSILSLLRLLIKR